MMYPSRDSIGSDGSHGSIGAAVVPGGGQAGGHPYSVSAWLGSALSGAPSLTPALSPAVPAPAPAVPMARAPGGMPGGMAASGVASASSIPTAATPTPVVAGGDQSGNAAELDTFFESFLTAVAALPEQAADGGLQIFSRLAISPKQQAQTTTSGGPTGGAQP